MLDLTSPTMDGYDSAMGAKSWRYFVPYQPDVPAALEALRTREFKAGRYWTPAAHVSSAPPHSIEEAVERSGATGTRSIPDMLDGISPTPRNCCVSPLSLEQLIVLFGTAQPTREAVEKSLHPRAYIEQHTWLPDHVERGRGIYVVVYDGGDPTELFFYGYSFD